ncbi:MAG: hypothetical protein ACRDCS_10960, partial [Tannerellaceae bacterium]
MFASLPNTSNLFRRAFLWLFYRTDVSILLFFEVQKKPFSTGRRGVFLHFPLFSSKKHVRFWVKAGKVYSKRLFTSFLKLIWF